MNQRIIYNTDDGGVAVIIPAPECGRSIEEIAAKDVPQGKSFDIVDVAAIPTDRAFRNAWVKQGKAIGHDMTKAKGIAHDKRRAARAAEFAPLDVEVTIPAKAAQAEAARQVIRDKYATMQTQIDAATTVEQIKAIISSGVA